MKKIVFLFLIVFIFSFCKAQKYADKEYYLIDSLELESLDSYNENILDSTLSLYHKTNEDTIKLFYLDYLISNMSDFIVVEKYNNYMYIKAKESLNNTNKEIIKNNIKFYLATSYGNKGTLYSFENEDDSTFFYYTKSLNLFTEINDLSGIANMNGSLGVEYDIKGDIKKALYYYNEGLKAAELSENHQSIAMSLTKIASIQKDYREFDKALENGKKAIEHAILAEDHQTHIMVAQLIANIYIRSDEFEKALSYAKNSIEICQKINSDYWIVDGYNLLGKIYFGIHQIDSSEHYFNIASNEAENINAIDVKMIALHGLAKISIKNLDFENAEKYANEGHEIAIKLKSVDYISKSTKILADIFEYKEDYKSALNYYQIYSGLKDSLHNSKTQKDAIRLGIQYDYEKEVALVEQEKIFAEELATKNRNLFIASIIGGGALLLLSLFFIYQLQLKKRAELAEVKLLDAENKIRLERKLNDAEMKALKSQMNPHFLFNAFNSIQEFIILNNRELASDYLGKFADLMRLYLDHSREKTIVLEKEIEATSLYLELEKIRFEDTLSYTIDVAQNIDASSIKLPPMLIQPFIENSLKHGLLHKKNDRQLKVNFSLDADVLTCIVEDNGIGRKQSAILNEKRMKKHKSFATPATQNRIELLNIGREKDITLQIIDLVDEANNALGTKVAIKIPLV